MMDCSCLHVIDPAVASLIEREQARQAQKIILIPSESICPKPVLDALASPFSNIYAEGYPSRDILAEGEQALLDQELQGAQHRRYYDRRFYKGCEHANVLEALACMRVKRLFATGKHPPESISANIQPLSGAAANNAVYSALLKPGDVIMGMSLYHGGHLTHGSELNRSGKTYRAAAYEVSPLTETLDYERILKLALEHRPRMIIGGYTSYPWAPDWRMFREIADRVGAFLFADVAHPAGMIAAGVYPNPIDYADIVTFTTHKTLFGPRGAVILTTNPGVAEAIDQAVFPGEQGGPHVNSFAAMAVAFGIAGTGEFRETQKKIVENARRLAAALERNGLTLAYGGTDTHLLVLNLRGLKTKNGFPLKGDTAARILDLAGIVANKNTIPGDDATAEASGVRMGTPWITQLGIARDAIDELAAIIADVVKSIHPFSYRGLGGTLPRGKIELELLEQAKLRARRVVEELSPGVVRDMSGSVERPSRTARGRGGGSGHSPEHTRATGDRSEIPSGRDEQRSYALLRVRGERALQFCDEIGTNDVSVLGKRESCRSFLLRRDGSLLAPVAVSRLEKDEQGSDQFLLLMKSDRKDEVSRWLRGLSDGYVLFDDKDIYRKVEGPVALEELPEEACPSELLNALRSVNPSLGGVSPGANAPDLYRAFPEAFDLSKPYFIGEGALKPFQMEKPFREEGPLRMEKPFQGGKPLGRGRPFSGEQAQSRGASSWEEALGSVEDGGTSGTANAGARPSCLYEEHLKLTTQIVEFAGWKMPVRYEGILDEHRAVREAAGLFDVSHMGILEVSGEKAERFLDILTTNYVPLLRDGESQYSYLLEPDGAVVDDIIIYRINRERYLIVVNAANAGKDLAWLRAVNEGVRAIDTTATLKRAPGPVTITDLKDPDLRKTSSERDRLVNIALQGPASLAILVSLPLSEEARFAALRLERTRFARMEIAGLEVILSRTGYTGENVGFELLVHPDQAPALWNRLLSSGGTLGLKPAGLGARDSLRVEAGLPLYGHELAGPMDISPLEAGFGPYVKFHKPFFIGRDGLLQRESRSAMTVARFQKTAMGTKMAKQGDPVINKRAQKVVGFVTSCAVNAEGVQVGMAFVERAHARDGTRIGIFSSPPGTKAPATGRAADAAQAGGTAGPGSFTLGKYVPVYDDAVILSRFPGKPQGFPKRQGSMDK